MLDSKATQFQLSPDGQILWQEKPNNPLPGVPVAKLSKGEDILSPAIEVLENAQTASVDSDKLKDALSLWLKTYLGTVLEPLMMLGVENEADDPAVRGIARKLYAALGILPREDMAEEIAQLDPEKRAALRAKKVRLGPVLVFIPALNKPAAVRLRGLLWCLYQGKALPAPVPADGIVSVSVGEAPPMEEAFYRSVGYPLYAGRAVRIDMLDRVISAVYDHAKDGKFQARHEMAEWLGCPIADLYAILEAMGHKKIHDPADVVPEVAPEVSSEEAAAVPDVSTEIVPEAGAAVKPAEVKPELATFALRRGKGHGAHSSEGKGGKPFAKGGHTDRNGKKPDRKKDQHKKKDHKSKKDKPKKDQGPRVITIEAKKREEDSPFAILQQLKTK
ncbi:MAG: hypothetical protein KDI13_02230 [Alphaproteobacteria bacterium]|nr:hypothetical protein [Alphaproteobacteria bacterium]